ncbi:MAG: FkbM family methyltransferase [Candidatus Omnitrophica bacterium]|nr:FkbM family methyltransferase [Candidatus Omnitrophota bacterium]
MIVNKAVWNKDGHVSFGVEGGDGGSIYLKTKTIAVETLRLKDLIEKETFIDFLKLDIEGAETEVLIDCQDVLGRVKNIFIEYHSFIGYPQALDKILYILSKNNFRYYFYPVSRDKSPAFSCKLGINIDFQINIFAYKRQ